MDQTAIYFESKSKTVVAPRGKKTISVRDSASNAQQLTLIAAIAANGNKLPPFFIFKGQPDKKLETSMTEQGIFCCAQSNAWWDEGVSKKWVNLILQPYIEENNAQLVYLLVDHFRCHLQSTFVNACNKIGVEVDYIPAGYTCVLQPVDVGFNAPLKKHVKDQHHQWCIEAYRGLPHDARVPIPKREDIVLWVENAYDRISAISIRNTFKHIGFTNVLENNDDDGSSDSDSSATVKDYTVTSEVTCDPELLGDSEDVIEYKDIHLTRLRRMLNITQI